MKTIKDFLVNEDKTLEINVYLGLHGAITERLNEIELYVSKNKCNLFSYNSEQKIEKIKSLDDWKKNIGGGRPNSLDFILKHNGLPNPMIIFY